MDKCIKQIKFIKLIRVIPKNPYHYRKKKTKFEEAFNKIIEMLQTLIDLLKRSTGSNVIDCELSLRLIGGAPLGFPVK